MSNQVDAAMESMTEYLGIGKAASVGPVVGAMRDLLVALHHVVPYWVVVIPVAALAIRCLTSPFLLWSKRIEMSIPAVMAVYKRVGDDAGLDPRNRDHIMDMTRWSLMRAYKCGLWRLFIPGFCVQLPLFVLFALAARK